MVRRILIVSPHFPPTNAADSHRARTVVPLLKEYGWQPEVLAVAAACVAAPNDKWLSEGIPADVVVHRAPALGLQWARVPGLGTLDLRARAAVRRTGDRILAAKKFDLIYFSTTVFGILPLALHWKRRFGVPFVVDYQDPWVNDYYHIHPDVRRPGGWLKYWVVDRLARYQEPRVLSECAGITAVSPAYPTQLRERYPTLPEVPIMVAPFPASKRDFERAREGAIRQDCFNPRDGKLHWVYVGRGGEDMKRSVEGLFSALSRWRAEHRQELMNLQVHFIGTSYAPAGRGIETIKPIAARFGLEDCVQERTDRIPYSSMLNYIADADALIVPGSDDPAYNASKLFPYLLARKPTLLLFHEASPVTDIVRRLGGATLLSFNDDTTTDQLSERIIAAWFAHKQYERTVALDEDQFAEYTDRGQSRQLCAFFDNVLANLTCRS